MTQPIATPAASSPPPPLSHSPDALQQRQAQLLAAIAQAAPELLRDAQLDLEQLKALLGQDHTAAPEHYELNWAGKAAARREIQKTSSHTLLPAASNHAAAPHMLIEGENLEVLRVLQKSYYGKVKMIYIDPPYNTGNDSFVYPDDYSETLDEYQRRTGEKNEAGYLNKQSLWKKNSKESGQYHSAWLSMMYPRLYLARNLLRDDGVIFISIDDNEAANLKLLCDEVFGAENFVANIIWNHTKQSKNDEPYFSRHHNQIFCYLKNSYKLEGFKFERTDENNKNYSNPDNDPRGDWRAGDVRSPSFRKTLKYTIQTTSGKRLEPPENGWRWNEETLLQKIADNEIIFSTDETKIIRKIYLVEQDGRTPENLWLSDFAGTTRDATNELKELFGNAPFDTPKPSSLIKKILTLSTFKTDLILDFFAGSGTTAQAVMELNLEDGGTRQCICVQMPEVLDEASEAYKAGYRTIADITRARIDKVIAKLKAEQPDKTTDLACAQFTLAPSNFKVWRSDVANADALREQLAMFQTAEKAAPSSHANPSHAHTAMLAELLLKHGLGALGVHAVSTPLTVGDATIHRVALQGGGELWLCFDAYSAALKAAMTNPASANKPTQVLLLNSCFTGDQKDELLANVQLELKGLGIGLTLI